MERHLCALRVLPAHHPGATPLARNRPLPSAPRRPHGPGLPRAHPHQVLRVQFHLQRMQQGTPNPLTLGCCLTCAPFLRFLETSTIPAASKLAWASYATIRPTFPPRPSPQECTPSDAAEAALHGEPGASFSMRGQRGSDRHMPWTARRWGTNTTCFTLQAGHSLAPHAASPRWPAGLCLLGMWIPRARLHPASM